MNAAETVTKWVSKRSSFYFFLPDGPYGRPFDNQYSIQRIEKTSNGFDIFLSDELILVFIGNAEVVDEGCNIIISGFERCKFLEKNIVKVEYDYGEVVLNGF
ncbi:hypothetical protein [[Enterobacter] lignolyticus]|uniref:Uncharacterized protein n=1 Tax=[Enterobacter] lignolyticus TaxID=1334193 RepID=A0A806X7Y8_9ENTR|nr:hypothetical protein [[Enterobacter] lignolyticus]ALR74829.1 hypothetical protein AO703_00310 [[Enterobacter] lignolyticus]